MQGHRFPADFPLLWSPSVCLQHVQPLLQMFTYRRYAKAGPSRFRYSPASALTAANISIPVLTVDKDWYGLHCVSKQRQKKLEVLNYAKVSCLYSMYMNAIKVWARPSIYHVSD